MNRSRDWLRQAEDDALWAADTLASGRYAQACFVCQQSAEKALKALALHRGVDRVKSHSTLEIARALSINGEVEEAAKRLDQYYISGRYPDAFPAGAPFEFFTRSQASEALALADIILQRVRSETGKTDG
ncbi:MAG: HEPN domain-containing protein [Clostridia bacterium]|nr:HEPN domain-containing protein [Deltaproteobacteria bacterium]